MGRDEGWAIIERQLNGNGGPRPQPDQDPRSARPLPAVIGLVFLATVFLASLIVNKASFDTVVLTAALGAGVVLLAPRLARKGDIHWLPLAIIAGYLAKLIASGARYWALVNIYHGVGDAAGYHYKGLTAADVWRSFSIPEIGTGSDFIPPATGLIYVPYKPSMLGGFFLFATLAFVGQLFMLAGFRYVTSARRFKWYAVAILFSPTILYWPSSIGKESLMFLFIGPAAYGTARLLSDYKLRWSIPIALGLAGAGVIRAHIAFLLAGALVFAVAFAKAPAVSAAGAKRFVLLGTSGVVLVAALLATSQRFGFDLSAGVSADVVTEEVDPFLEDLSERTDSGGSAVEGGLIQSPADIPEATLRVLFRPLPWEATNIQTFVAALEGGLMLAICLIRLPIVILGLRRLRRTSYALFSLVYTSGFVYGFSAIVNLGILARQRSQVMPFLFAFLVELGLRDKPRQTREPATLLPEKTPALIQ